MLFPGRRDGRYHRLVPWQIGLFFLGSGTWVGGLLTGRSTVTGIAIVILLVAALLGLVGRRGSRE